MASSLVLWRSWLKLLLPVGVAASILCGCSGAALIDLEVADYRESAAKAGDAQLLLNILRLKDDVPIHFSDLSLIHGSVQLTAGVTATVPFGAPRGSTQRAVVTPNLGGQTTPTFDLGTLDTQDFTKGILSPIDPKIVKTFLDQGVDDRLIFILFFSEFRGADGRQFLNNTACDPAYPINEAGECRNRIYDYLSEIDRLLVGKPPLRANIYVELTPVGGMLTGQWNTSQLKDLSGIDSAKFRFIGNQLYSISSPQIALCYERDRQLRSLFSSSRLGDEVCTRGEIVVPPGTRSGKMTSLSLRSTYDIMKYLGQILRFQEEKGNNRCITLHPQNRFCDTGEVLFQVNAATGRPVVWTNYAGDTYSISARGCNLNRLERCDYSLQVLSLVELLLNANKAAKDILSTPRVQVVQ